MHKRRALGIPPRKGPKYGIILVMHTMILTKRAHSAKPETLKRLIIIILIKVKIPIIRESIILPSKKSMKILRDLLIIFHILLACSYLKVAKTIRLIPRICIFLSIRR